jgi:antitoxin (DNA-binding transcriptional repressor) of toxin-antitoxin stability system
MEVNIRQFRLNLAQLLNEPSVEITRRGKVIGVYTNTEKNKNVYTKIKNETPEEVPDSRIRTKQVESKPVENGTSNFVPKYACGCKMGDTRLCPKHHRS